MPVDSGTKILHFAPSSVFILDMDFNGDLFETLSWLPSKPLFRFTSLYKSFRKLLSEPFFIKKQCLNMNSKGDSCFFIEPYYIQRSVNKLELYSLPSDKYSSNISSDSLIFLSNTSRILASSNGLLCCMNIVNDPKDQLFICNPATHSFMFIPTPDDLDLKNIVYELNVVFECNTNSTQFSCDYTLMIPWLDKNTDWSSKFLCKIWDPKKRTWNDKGFIQTGERNLNFEISVFQDGVVYYISHWSPSIRKESPFYWQYIVAHDVENEITKFLKIPKDARKGLHHQTFQLKIFNWENPKTSSSSKSICLVRLLKNRFTVWVLKDKETSSWERILKKRVRAMGVLMEEKTTISGFTVLNGNSLLIATDEKVYSYKFSSDESNGEIEVVCWHECGTSVLFNGYSNTLRPCGDGATPLPV